GGEPAALHGRAHAREVRRVRRAARQPRAPHRGPRCVRGRALARLPRGARPRRLRPRSRSPRPRRGFAAPPSRPQVTFMPSIPVELKAPDIEPHRRSATGTDFIHTLESGKPGPHVLVNALTHGNEICGAIVVDRLLRRELRPVRGTLTLAFANVEAFFRFDPASPYASRFVDEDFNRVWTPDVLDGPRETAELRRARMLRPFVDAADYLLDIHSMLEPSPPVMICG